MNQYILGTGDESNQCMCVKNAGKFCGLRVIEDDKMLIGLCHANTLYYCPSSNVTAHPVKDCAKCVKYLNSQDYCEWVSITERKMIKIINNKNIWWKIVIVNID